MAICEVVLVPDARLKQVCAPVEQFDAVLRAQIGDLEDTRLNNAGCVGIAAPQIGIMRRIAIVDTSGHKKFGAASSGHLTLVNPRLARCEGERLGREGCLSLPDFTANVRRALHVTIEFQDENGVWHSVDSADFESVVLQHEIDHLDGILFLDRVANLQTDVFARKARK